MHMGCSKGLTSSRAVFKPLATSSIRARSWGRYGQEEGNGHGNAYNTYI